MKKYYKVESYASLQHVEYVIEEINYDYYKKHPDELGNWTFKSYNRAKCHAIRMYKNEINICKNEIKQLKSIKRG